MHKVQMNSSEQVRVVGTVTIYSDFVDFKKSVSEQLLQNVVGSRAKLKFKWLSDNKVEVRTTCSAADAHKIELLIESCDVTKLVAWSSSANSNRKVSDKVMRKVQMNSSAGCDDYVKLSTATLKRKLKNATPEEKKCIQAELNARGVYSKRSVNSAETSNVGPCFAALWPAYIDDEYKCACCGRTFPAGHNSVSLGGHKPDGMHFIFEYTKENRVGNSVNYDPYNLPPEDPEGGIFKVLVGEDADEEGYRWLNFCRNCWPKLTSMSPEEIYAKYSEDDSLNSSRNASYVDVDGILGSRGDVWTVAELADYWEREQVNDPILSEYATYEDWLEDTLAAMRPLNSSRKVNSSRKEGNNSMRKVIFRGKLNSSRKRMNSSRSPKYTAYSISDLGALEDEYGYGPGELVDVVKQGEATIGGKFLGFTNDDNMYFVFEEDGKPVAYEQSHDRWFPVNSSRKRMNSSRRKLNSSLVDTFIQYHDDEENYNHQAMNYDKLYDMLNAYAKPGENSEDMDVDKLFERAPETEQRAMIALIDPENWREDFDSSRKRTNSSRKGLNSSSDIDKSTYLKYYDQVDTIMAAAERLSADDGMTDADTADSLADMVAETEVNYGKVVGFLVPKPKYFSVLDENNLSILFVLADGGIGRQFGRRFYSVDEELAELIDMKLLNSSRKRTNSSRKRLNSSSWYWDEWDKYCDAIPVTPEMQKAVDMWTAGDGFVVEKALVPRNRKVRALLKRTGAVAMLFTRIPGGTSFDDEAILGWTGTTVNDDLAPYNLVDIMEAADVDWTDDDVAMNSSRKRTNSSRKGVNSSRRKLNSSEDDVTADDDVQDTGIDGGDTATETAEILDDALIVQNPETKEVSLFVATEDDEVLPESVDVIAEVTPVVEGAVLDSSRRLKRFAAAKLNSSKGCLNSDAEDVCPACGNPVSECTCEPGTVAYDEIQLPDDTVVEVENILVVQGEDDDLGLFMPETADEAVPDEYEVVAIANPVAEAEVLDSSRRMKKSNSKKLNSSVKKRNR